MIKKKRRDGALRESKRIKDLYIEKRKRTGKEKNVIKWKKKEKWKGIRDRFLLVSDFCSICSVS